MNQMKADDPQKMEKVLAHSHSLHLIFRRRHPLLKRAVSHCQLHQSSLLSLLVPCLDQPLSLGILIQIRVPCLVHHQMFLDTFWKSIQNPYAFTVVHSESPLAWIIEFVSDVITFLSSLCSLFSQQQSERSYLGKSSHFLIQSLPVAPRFPMSLS